MLAAQTVTYNHGGGVNAGAGTVAVDAGFTDTGIFPNDTPVANAGPGSIVNGAAIGEVNITAGGIVLSAHGGAIGSRTSPLLVDHTGTGDIGALTADTGIDVTQTGGPLQVSTASSTAGGIVDLTVANSGARIRICCCSIAPRRSPRPAGR